LSGFENDIVESALSGEQATTLGLAQTVLSIRIEKVEGSAKTEMSLSFPANGTGENLPTQPLEARWKKQGIASLGRTCNRPRP
jgi:hypothetical protein